MSLQLLPAPPLFSPTFSLGQHRVSVTEPEGHRALPFPARPRRGVRFSPSPAPCPPSLDALVAPSVPSCCSRASGQRHLWYRHLARPPSSLPPDAESISKVSSHPNLLPCVLLNPPVSTALCSSLSWPVLVLPDSPSAPSQLRYNGISTPASLLSHTTAGGLLSGSACVCVQPWTCARVGTCLWGCAPRGLYCAHALRSRWIRPSVCSPPAPAGPWASPPPAHAGPWPLTQTLSILSPDSALIHLTCHVPSSRPGTRLLRHS